MRPVEAAADRRGMPSPHFDDKARSVTQSHSGGSEQTQRDQVLSEYLRAVEAGIPVDREELLARHPSLAGHLRQFFAAQDAGAARQTGQAVRMSEPSPGCEAPTLTFLEAEAAHETQSLPPRDDDMSPRQKTEVAPSVRAKDRSFGDYELLAEIARGGMGVVFKARQVSLKRIVAVKMILAGQLSGDADVRRFHAEAAAAAHLDHPCIVPVYEVGQHQGQHYFSMGFVDGPSLAKQVASGPLPPREAAELVVKVAGAIAYAHERGVIHRDLKPGNILLDKNRQPRVTDFGLAKRTSTTAEGSGVEALTATGQILGTPSYMPPEQAAGKSDVGPLADVYSLGAVLYTLLTGRPPFQSANMVDTLLAVLEEEPIAPRKLVSSLPLDLSTICLKCLEKEPHRRYGSASELADELQRYLNGAPILARPISRVERAARWIARHPKKAGATGFGLLAVVLVASIVSAQMRAVREESDRQLLVAAEENDRRRAESLVEAVLTAPSEAVPYAVENLRPLSRHALPILRARFSEENGAKNQRLHAALALAALGEVDEAFFVDAIVDSSAAESRSILAALVAKPETVIPQLTARAEEETRPETKARLALSLLELGDPAVARELVKISPDPAFRTTLIHQAAPTWRVSAARLLNETADSAVRYSLCLGVGLSPAERFSPDEKKELGQVLTKLYQDAPDGATHSAADWTLRQWQVDLPKLPRGKLADKPASRDWFVNRQGMTLIQIAADRFMMGVAPTVVETPAGKSVEFLGGTPWASFTSLTGPGGVVTARGQTGPRVEARLTRPYWLANREVTVAQFEAFVQDAKYFDAHPAERLGENFRGYDKRISKTADSPVQNVRWEDAALYCNWLSRQEGLTPCYERKIVSQQLSQPEEKVPADGKVPAVEVVEWVLKPESNGYRLPTEPEWECACRAGADTRFCFGNGESLIGSYAVYVMNSEQSAQPVGSKLPNARGIFDMHGNVDEWCQDGYAEKLPGGADSLVAGVAGMSRIFRGGNFSCTHETCQAAMRMNTSLSSQAPVLGFRVALVQPGERSESE